MSLQCHLTLSTPTQPPLPPILSILFVNSSVRSFSSRPDQTHMCQKLASVLEILRNANLAFLNYIFKKNAPIKISETYNMTYFILGTNFYLFRHQSGILKNLLNTKICKSNAYINCYSSSRYVRWHQICPTVQPNEIHLDHILSQMFIQTCTKYKQLWSCTRRESLLHGVVITAMWTVLVKMYKGDFRYWMMKMRATEPEVLIGLTIVCC